MRYSWPISFNLIRCSSKRASAEAIAVRYHDRHCPDLSPATKSLSVDSSIAASSSPMSSVDSSRSGARRLPTAALIDVSGVRRS
jgi:hypothetical protein